MARATAGVEATDWREAVHWLQMIEADAETAEESARWAVQHVSRDDLDTAVREARAAVDLEVAISPTASVGRVETHPGRVRSECS